MMMTQYSPQPTAATRAGAELQSTDGGPRPVRHRFNVRSAVRLAFYVVTALLLSVGVGQARAAVVYTWTNPNSGVWSVAANWSPATVPVSNNTNSVVFGGTTSYTSTYDLTTNPFIINSLQFNNSSAGGVTFAASNANGIRLGGTTPSFVQNGSGAAIVTVPLLINTNGATLSGTGTGDVSISNLTFTAGNTLTLSDAANVSIASLGNTDTSTTAKTVTNNVTAAGKALTIGTLSLGGTGNNTFSIGGSGTTTVTGVVSETGSLVGNFTKADGGTVFLQGANTFTGTLQVNNGILDVNSLADSGAGSNGTGAIGILNGANASAELRYSGAAPVTLTRAINIFATGATAGSAIIDNSGGGGLTIGAVSQSGATTPTKTLVLQGSYIGSTNTVAGVISNGTGTLGVTKAGSDTWTLANANTYSGPTTVTGGTLIGGTAGSFGGSQVFSAVNGGAIDASAAGGLTITAGGSLTAGHATGSGADVIGNVSLTGATLNVGGSGAAATFTHTGSLTIGDVSTLQFDLNNVNTVGAGVNDLVAVSQNLALSGTINVNLNALNGPLASGNYELFTYGGTLTGGTANLAAPTGLAAGRSTYGYNTSTPGAVFLTVTGNAGNLTWTGGANANTWDVQNTVNFTGEANSQFFNGDVVNFTDTGSSAGPVNLSGALQPFSVNVTSANNYTFAGSGSIAGSAVVNKSGAGTLTVQTINTYTGATNVSGGTLVATNASALGTAAGATVVSSGAQVQLNNVGTIAEPFSLNGTGVGGAGSLQNVAGATTLSGLITLQSNASIINADAANTLTLSAASGSSVTGSGFGLTIGGPGSVAINSPITTGSGGLTKVGASTLTLAGAAANTYTGLTTVNGGTVILNKTSGVNAIAGGGLAIGNGTDPALVQLATTNQIADAARVTVNANATFDLNGNSEIVGAIAGAGSVTLGNNSALLTVSGATTDTFSGVISGTGSFSRLGAGTTILTNHNTYTGTTNVQNAGATIRLGVTDALPVATTVTFLGTTAANTVLDLNGFNQTISALTSATTTGSVYVENDSGAGTSVLTITNGVGGGPAFTASTGTAQIRDNNGVTTGGKVALNVTGGTTVFGSTNVYSGPTTVTGGTLIAAKAGALSPNSALDVEAAATVDLDNTNQTVPTLTGLGTVTSGGPAVLTVTNGTFPGTLANGLSITKANGGTFTLSGLNNTFTGTLQVNNGTLAVNSLADGGTGSNGTGSIRLLNGTNAAAQLTYLGTGAVTTRSLDIFGTGTNTTATVDSSGTGPLTLGGASVSGSAPKVLGLQGTNTGNNTIAGPITDGTGSIAVTKSGAGTWVLAGENTYSGNTTVNAGTLKLTSAVSSNNVPTSPVITVGSGAKLDVTGIANGFTLALNQSLKGGGTVAGVLNLVAGSTVSPGIGVGTLSTDDENWGGAAAFAFDIADASGGPQTLAGTNWDELAINGALTVSSTPAAPFVVKLTSVSGTTPGDAADFDPSQNYSWTIASTTGGVVGFDPAKFIVDASGFTNATNGGLFTVSASGNNVQLNYVTTAVPEPATATGLVALGLAAMSRRKRRAASL